MLTVSICMIAYNEENVIEDILEHIKLQDYLHDKIEVVLINNNSGDSTELKMQQFAQENIGFSRVVVKTNNKTSQASGWNVAIKEATGDIIIRIDAHASIPVDFVSKNVKCIEEHGEFISGGPRPNVIYNSTPWKETLLLAESSMFGSSIAGFRRKREKTYVNSMFHAAYRKEVFENVGGFNENLGRTEDNELHYRIRQAGYRLCYDPEIISYQHIRSSLSSMLKQKFGNGYWVGLTTGVCLKCLSLYHFVPFLFVMAIIGTSLMDIVSAILKLSIVFKYSIYFSGIMWFSYMIVACLMAVLAIVSADKKQRNISNLMLPFLFFLLHLSYGVGTLKGLIQMPLFVKGIKHNGTDKER